MGSCKVSKVIQLLGRLNCPKSVKLQQSSPSGASLLSRHELYAAMCVSADGLGVDVVLATEVGDSEALDRLQSYLEKQLGYDSKARSMTLIVVSELCDLPIGKVRNKIKSLLKRCGARANRSRRLIASWEKGIKSLEKTGRHSELIAKHREDIKRERESLNAFAESYAGRSCHCPKCGGTGIVKDSRCSSCGGLGRFRNSSADWECQLKAAKVAYSSCDIALIESLVSSLSDAKSEAIAAMGARSRSEQLD